MSGWAAPALGQVSGANIGGVVTDDTGGALPGVTVTLTNQANGASQVLVTGAEGNYRAVALQPAMYEISAELSGFGTVRRRVTLNVGADVTLNLTLGVAAVEETVTVVAETPLVEVTKSQPTSVIVPDQIAALPVLSRSFLELAQLLPGAAPTSGSFMTTKFAGTVAQRSGFTTIIDGGTVDDAIWGAALVNVTQDAVQEFSVYRHQFSAQYSSALNAVVNVATKSGTNDFRGTGFYFGRDRKLNARDAFADEKPPFDQQRVGFSLGGPIIRDETHFFGVYEYDNRDRAVILALPPSNPFAAQENGVWPSGSSDHMAATKFNHRFNDRHSLFVRYLYDNQYILRERNGAVSNQLDEFNRTHSVVAQESWVVSDSVVNTFNVHYLWQRLGLLSHSDETTIDRPSITLGSVTHAPQFFPRTNLTLAENLYFNLPRHSLVTGVVGTFFSGTHESFWNDQGSFDFTTDAPFNPNDPSTWPFAFSIQEPGVWKFRSTELGLFVQDDWRVADRLRLNLGLRYDLNTNLRNNDFYESLIDDPLYAGIENFISKDRGNDYSNFQPRVGFTWDMRGTGHLVMRGGFGVYSTRNRPWWQLTSQDLSKANAVRVEDPQRLRHYPDISAVLGGQSIAELAANVGRPLYLISDNFVLPTSYNSTIGIGWQINPVTSLDVDYIHDYAVDGQGTTERNLPETGRISPTNPRPVRNFTSVRVLENFSKSWYDALEVQLRTRVRGSNSLQISYALSKTIIDGVEFYLTQRGTQRTPQQKGYSSGDNRHNVSVAASIELPWEFQLSGVFRALSGSPHSVQAGLDLDGDGSTQGDRPPGLPPTVGRENVDRDLETINEFRASLGLPAIDRSLLDLDPNITLSMRLTKGFDLGAARRLEVFLEGYNLTNYVSFTGGNSRMRTRSFLIRTGARDARQIQWGARYQF